MTYRLYTISIPTTFVHILLKILGEFSSNSGKFKVSLRLDSD